MSSNALKVKNSLQLINQSSAPSSPASGEVYYDSTLNLFQFYQNGSWTSLSGSGATTIGTIDTGTPSSNGAQINSGSLILQSASASNPGLVNNTTQTLSGAKTLSGITTISNATTSTSTTTGALIVTGGVGIAGALNLGTALSVPNGGTGATTFSVNQVVLGGTTSTGALAQVAGGTSGYVLTSTGATSAPTWQANAGAGGSSSVGTIDSQSASSNGAVITGSTLYMQSASASNPGLVNVTTQIFAGQKTFDGAIKFNGNTGLPVSAGGALWIAAGYASPVVGRLFIGDGSGWQFNISKLASSTITDLFTFNDSGSLSINSGTLGVGGIGSSSVGIDFVGTTLTGTIQTAFNAQWTGTSAATSSMTSYLSAPTTPASTTVSDLYHYRLIAPTIGSSGTITTQVGILVQALTGATNNAILADNNSFTGTWFINQSGAQASTFGGIQTLTNSTSTSSFSTGALVVSGGVGIGGSTNIGGTLGVGQAGSSTFGILVAGSNTSGTTQVGIRVGVTYTATGTNNLIAYDTSLTTAASTAVSNVLHFRPQAVTVGSSGSVINQVYYLSGALSGATNNAAFTDTTSLTGNWFIYQAGNAPSSTGGALAVANATASTSTTTGALTVSGGIGAGGAIHNIYTAASGDSGSFVNGLTSTFTNPNGVAFTNTTNAIQGVFNRNVTTSVTDTGQLSVFNAIPQFNVSTSITLTNTNSAGVAAVTISGPTNSGSGTLAITNYSGIYVNSSSLATGTNKYGVYINSQSGATNNYGLFANGMVSVGAYAENAYQYVTATGNFTVNNNVSTVIVNAGAQTTLTVTMPAAPVDGQIVRFAFVGAITTLTVSANGGQTLDGSPTSSAINSGFAWIYRLANTTWFRLQ